MIVQADNLQTGLPQVIVAMVTSNIGRANHKSRVTVRVNSPEGKQSGLVSDSVIATDNLATIQEKFIDKAIGSLPDMSEIDLALANTFGLKLL